MQTFNQQIITSRKTEESHTHITYGLSIGTNFDDFERL